MNNENMIIVGAGASGLCAAIVNARAGLVVTLLEQNSKVGRKILASGNGKCNISNKYIDVKRFHSQNPFFVEKVLDGYDFLKVKQFFTSIGIELIEGKDGKMFPMSLQASSVVEVLEYEAKLLGVNIICNCKVQSIIKKDNSFILDTSLGQKTSQKLLIASGLSASPQLGGNSSGVEFAKSMGHSTVDSYPALTQLCSDESWVKRASGVKVEGVVKLYTNGEYVVEKKGDLLFTNYGISGLAILDISREVSIRLANYEYCELSLDLMPNISKEKLTTLLLNRVKDGSQKPIELWLQGVVNKKLIAIILEQSKSRVKVENQLNTKEIKRLTHSIKNIKLNITDTRGFKGAEVATGGIDTKDVNFKTMESKLIENLFFTGEVLDVDGDRGGFNFHFAWVCGLRSCSLTKSWVN